MPIVKVTLFKGRTEEQKEKMVREITEALCRTINVKPEDVIVIIEEIDKRNYAIGGKVFGSS